jgi:secreted PhoX family phosphatase
MDPMLERASRRFGMRQGPSAYRWEAVDERFDQARYPTEPMKFGWVVEIDPLDPSRPVSKRTALGRLRHEGATTTLSREGRPVVYMGDDSPFEYFYKFVSDHALDRTEPAASARLLDDGRLYVAKLNEDGSGEWLPLVYGERPELTEANGFSSQADVVIRCREAADLLGATPLDRPEDVAVHPHNGRVYLACTQGLQRGVEPTNQGAGAASGAEAPEFPGVDAANPRSPNPYGHILEFVEADDASSERFRWEVFILAGDPASGGLASDAVAGRLEPAATYYAGQTDASSLSAFACPDNLGFDQAGNLWIVTDGSQPDERNNNGCFVCPTEGPARGAVRQFMSGPVGAEICGCTFSPDGETLFLTVQHPGSSSPIEAPTSHWPDGGESQPRSSLIAVRAIGPETGSFT